VRDLPGEIHIEVTGKNLSNLANEAGGHRIQRIPPTERKGRVHTSTVTVAVIDTEQSVKEYSDNDFRIEWYSGTGCGGQNRNKVQSCCRLTYIPANITVTSQTRSRISSLQSAKAEILKRLESNNISTHNANVAAIRRQQVGSGMRGDKIRTYQLTNDIVTDHNSGKKYSAKKILSGYFDLLW
jgi:peptide chain release factor 1